MTATRDVTIWCDGVDGRYPCVCWDMGDDAKSVRATLRREGWLVGLPGGRDLCPDHVHQRYATTGFGRPR